MKKSITEAHLHLPFLLRIAAAPPDLMPELAAGLNVEGEMSMEIDEDDPYAPTAEEIAAEEQEEPLMMLNADRWQRFLDLVAARAKPAQKVCYFRKGDILLRARARCHRVLENEFTK